MVFIGPKPACKLVNGDNRTAAEGGFFHIGTIDRESRDFKVRVGFEVKMGKLGDVSRAKNDQWAFQICFLTKMVNS